MKALPALQSVNNIYAEIDYFNEYETDEEDYAYAKAALNTEAAGTYYTMAHSMLLVHLTNAYRVLSNHHQKEAIEKEPNWPWNIYSKKHTYFRFRIPQQVDWYIHYWMLRINWIEHLKQQVIKLTQSREMGWNKV